jgi:hypothetical protein
MDRITEWTENATRIHSTVELALSKENIRYHSFYSFLLRGGEENIPSGYSLGRKKGKRGIACRRYAPPFNGSSLQDDKLKGGILFYRSVFPKEKGGMHQSLTSNSRWIGIL